MPTVPSAQVPTVSPSTSSDVGYQRSDFASPEALGAGIGRAMQEAGHAQQGLANELDRFGGVFAKHALSLQDRANQSAAKDLFLGADQELGNLTIQFNSLEGANANQAAYDKYAKDVQAVREKYRGLATNVEVAKTFDNDFARRAGFSIIDGARHVATQNKKYNNETSEALVKNTVQDAAAHPGNDLRFQDNLKLALNAVESQAQVHGWSEEETKLKKQNVASSLWASRIESIAQTQPFEARKLYNENMDKIDGLTRIKIENHLQQRDVAVGTRIRADEIANGKTYFGKLETQESGGNPAAKNPNSSAGGLGQFITSTWKGMMEKHPELGLTEKGRTGTDQESIDQQRRAIRAFTEDNVKYLRERGISTNEQNTYLAHFLGPEGAVSFLKGMAKDPNQSALALVPERVAQANPKTFFKPDGTPRTAQEVYNFQTARFAGPGPLTPDSDGNWLSGAINVAKEIAQRDAPNNPAYEDTLISRVKTEYNNVKTAHNEAEIANFNAVQGAVMGNGDPAKFAKSIDVITSDVGLSQAFNELSPSRQKQILAQIEKNAKADVPLTPERFNKFQSLMGLKVTDPKAFSEIIAGNEDLTRVQQAEILKAQRGMAEKLQNTSKINGALRTVGPMLADAGVVPSRSDATKAAQYNQFVGAFQDRLQQFEDQHKKFPNEAEQMQIASQLLRVSEPGGWFSSDRRAFEVPAEFKTAYTEKFQSRYGRPPTPTELATMYRRSQDGK